MPHVTRREVLRTAAAGTAALVAARAVPARAQSKEPIPIGTLCPLTGAGGAYGPDMQKAIVSVAERINKGGGIHGRPIQLFHEDSQTNPEAGRARRAQADRRQQGRRYHVHVRLRRDPGREAARAWSRRSSTSACPAPTPSPRATTAATSRAPSPTPSSRARSTRSGSSRRKEWKRVALMALQTPFAVPFGDTFTATVKPAGADHHRQPDLRGQEAVVPERDHARAGHQSRPDHARGLHARLRGDGEGALPGGLQGRRPRPGLRHQRQVRRGRRRARSPRASGPSIPRRRSTRPPTSSSPPPCLRPTRTPTRPSRGIT